jgi:hypothetical protein
MSLGDEQIHFFIVAWQVDFGEVLTPKLARSEASRLLDLFTAPSVPPRPNELPESSSGGHGDLGDVGGRQCDAVIPFIPSR